MSEIIWEDKYRAETQATKELEREVERLSKRQKEDEEAFWEERDARVEAQARVEELESYLDALSRGFDRPWREDFKEWNKAEGGSK